jgi:hypothetical protein
VTSKKVMGWPKASFYGALMVLTAFLALVEVPDLLLSSLTGMARDNRVYIVTAWFVLALAGIMWCLRRIQQRWMN